MIILDNGLLFGPTVFNSLVISATII